MTAFPKGLLLKDRYCVEDVLGKGAMSTVYLVRDNLLSGARWAAKEFDPQASVKDVPLPEVQANVNMFLRSGEIMSVLRHPGLPRLIDKFALEDRLYIIMERVQGCTLEEILNRQTKPLHPHEALPIALQVADILAYLHNRTPAVIFRDLKPSNLMISPTGRVRLIDFGIARYYTPSQDAHARNKDTQELGTPGFCAPEQYQGYSTPQSDIYALGVTLYYLLTLKDPQSFQFSFPPLRNFVNIPAVLDNMVASCLELDPQKRPEDIRQISLELEKALHTLPPLQDKSTHSLEPALIALARHGHRVPLEQATSSLKVWWQWSANIFGPASRRRP